ncbi:hypothetical protein CAPTEDRAFT_185176 [Capitella teleta]|uniref:Glycosyltransferase family 92 protein n=1 Tax=Capitella teleta TaxID=283909 RepID=R7VD99_CAPTE|nr:hypothetical protein CAPTEDRAFT_185176 [Capitella teleta]|eukprot:ELU14271.1 hypothetical protein CAPTEDRAFT_185176 [Capitella teleta]
MKLDYRRIIICLSSALACCYTLLYVIQWEVYTFEIARSNDTRPQIKGETIAYPCNSTEAYNVLVDSLPTYDNEPKIQHFGNNGGVYSAYLDNRITVRRAVRIIATLQKNTVVFCHLFCRSADGTLDFHMTEAEMQKVNVLRVRKQIYSYLIGCRIPEDFPTPHRVVLSDRQCGHPIASLPVFNQYTDAPKYNFTVCLHQPLFRMTLDDVPRILEWISVNLAFGAEHFVMYSLPSTDMIRKYLQPLVDIGLLDIHLFDIELRKTEDSHGQKCVINDCVYRYMYSSNRIILTDVDEFITPHSHDNWTDLLSNSPCADKTAAFFRNSFFPTQLVGESPKSDLQITVLQKTRKETEVWKCHKRSKLMVNPRNILICTVHYVFRVVGEERPRDECCMPVEMGYLQHYREYRHYKDSNPSSLKEITTDKRMWYFETKIISSLKFVYSTLNRTLPRSGLEQSDLIVHQLPCRKKMIKYMHKEEENIVRNIYEQLQNLTEEIPPMENLVIHGDFNVKIGKYINHFGLGDLNEMIM